MKKKKKINWRFKKLEYKLMEEYLEEMAMKGWIPSEINQDTAIFIPTEPRKMKFYVNVSPYEASSNYSDNNEDSAFVKNRILCEKYGWHFISSYDQMQFFYAEKNENTYRVQTDLELEQNIVIDNVCKKEIFKSLGMFIYVLFIVLFTLYGCCFTKGYFDYEILVSGPSLLNILVLFPLAFITSIASVVSNFIWYFNSKSNLGYKVNNKSLKLVKFRNAIFDVGNYMLFVVGVLILSSSFFSKGLFYNWTVRVPLVAILVTVVGSCILYNKHSETKKLIKWGMLFSIFLSITVFLYVMADLTLNESANNPQNIEIVPEKYVALKISDFTDTDEIDRNEFNKNYSPLVPISYEYYEYYNDDSRGLFYSTTTEYFKCINESIASIIYDGIINKYKNRKHYKKDIKSVPAENWNCDKASLVIGEISTLLLLNDNVVIKIYISEDLANVFDDKFKEKMLEKFINNN